MLVEYARARGRAYISADTRRVRRWAAGHLTRVAHRLDPTQPTVKWSGGGYLVGLGVVPLARVALSDGRVVGVEDGRLQL